MNALQLPEYMAERSGVVHQALHLSGEVGRRHFGANRSPERSVVGTPRRNCMPRIAVLRWTIGCG